MAFRGPSRSRSVPVARLGQGLLGAMSIMLLEWATATDHFLPLSYDSQVTIFIAQVVMALYLSLGIVNREVMRSAAPWLDRLLI